MEYKATWERFGKDGDYDYTVGDTAILTPADYLSNRCSFPPRDIDVPIGVKYGLDVSRVYAEIAESCEKELEGSNALPYSMDEYIKEHDLISEWREEDMGGLEIFGTLWKDEAKDRISVTVEYGDDYVGNLYRPGAFEISEVIFNNPATVVYWKDGTKTVVTDMDNVVDGKAKPADSYSKETGLALCYMKKALGNEGNYNNAFRKWIKED